jgi:DNA-directed RNA polymerase specialized sigma subunit
MTKYTNVPNNIFDSTLPFASSGQTELEPDYADAYKAWQTEDNPKTRGKLLRTVQPVVDTAIRSYAGKTSPAVQSQAKMLAMQSFKTYDPAKGAMKTHLLSNLQRLQRIAGQSAQPIHIPERIGLARNQLREAEEVLRDDLGRDPSDMEIANHTGLSLGRLAQIRKANSGINSGSVIDETGENYAPAVNMPGNTDAADAWQQMVYYDLGQTDQVIMDYSLGLHGTPKMSNTEIAQRLGITPGAVSQRKNKIQALLDEQYNVFGGNNG